MIIVTILLLVSRMIMLILRRGFCSIRSVCWGGGEGDCRVGEGGEGKGEEGRGFVHRSIWNDRGYLGMCR